jgi:hypothetical protein
LYLVWSNVHGGVLGGLATMVLAGAGWLLARWHVLRTDNGLSARELLHFGLLGAACAGTTLLTPFGWETIRAWLYINNGMPKLPELIEEHCPLDVTDSRTWPLVAGMVVLMLLLLSTVPTRSRVVWLVPLFWLVQSIFRVRHGALFAPVALVALVDFWPHTALAKWLRVHRPTIYRPIKQLARSPVNSIILTAILAVGVGGGIQYLGWRVPLVGCGIAVLDDRIWPTELADVMRHYEPRTASQPRNLFCEYSFGGYVIQEMPGYRVFVDDRCEVFGDDWLEEYAHAAKSDATVAMAHWQERFGPFDFALVNSTETSRGFDAYFRQHQDQWHCVQRTATASFYQRR